MAPLKKDCSTCSLHFQNSSCSSYTCSQLFLSDSFVCLEKQMYLLEKEDLMNVFCACINWANSNISDTDRCGIASKCIDLSHKHLTHQVYLECLQQVQCLALLLRLPARQCTRLTKINKSNCSKQSIQSERNCSLDLQNWHKMQTRFAVLSTSTVL